MSEPWVEFERRVLRRARELVGDQSPEFNMAPTIELVRVAFSMGYDLQHALDQYEIEHPGMARGS